ncbi:MAG: zinc ribbon domain-containing protein [Elusimicrobia bacterium]|nr:zinc ribbon domain-containing protein [Elusimicrobiota bacterium]
MAKNNSVSKNQPQQANVPAPMIECPACGTECKAKSRTCRKCGYDLAAPPLWLPTWKWHGKVLGIIYAVLIVGFVVLSFVLKQLPPPLNIRHLPPEITPWLKK